MKVLWLTNSDEIHGAGPVEERPSALTARLVEAERGEPIEMIPRVIWPSPELPAIVAGWVERYSPDLVVFHVNAFWFLYRSVPLRLRRRFGRPGAFAARAGFALGEASWFVRTRAYHTLRRFALKTFGGATYFTPEETCEITEACIRRIVSNEGVGLVLRVGDGAQFAAGASPGALAFVHGRLRAVCSAAHVTCVDATQAVPLSPPADFWKSGDRVHMTAPGRAWYARRDADAILAERRRRTESAPAETSVESAPGV